MEKYTDHRKDEVGSLEDIIMDGNREEMTKIRFFPWRLTRIIGASKTISLEG